MLTLALKKPGMRAAKLTLSLTLSLTKAARFTVTLRWSCNADHHGVHAHAAPNLGNGAGVSRLADVL